MADYRIPKDADFPIEETLTGENLTGATVTWMLLPLTARLGGDLDSLVAQALIAKDNALLGGVALTTPASGLFTVSLAPVDTHELQPGAYRVLLRYQTDTPEYIGVDTYEVTVTA